MPSQYSTAFLWPLMIWLHPDNSGNAWYEGQASTISVNDAAPQYQNVAYQRAYPSICIVPYADQTAGNDAIENWGGWVNTGGTGNGTTFNGETGPNTFALNGLVQHLIATLSIDPARVYVNGFSLGGIGAEYFMLRYNQANGNPPLYTAGTSTGGVLEIHGFGVGPSAADVTTMHDAPAWWISGQNDGTSNPTDWNTLMWQQLAGNTNYPAQAVSEAASRAGTSQYHFSYCAGVGHSPTNNSGVYMQSTPTVLNWLFAQVGAANSGGGVVPPVFTVSPNNTVVLAGSAALITDTTGITYGIVGGQVSISGTTDTTTSNVVELAYVNSVVWQKNSAGNWSSRSGGTWSAATTVSPLPNVSASGSVILVPTTALLTDASFNNWGITTSVGVVTENGTTITTPGGVIVVTPTNGLSVKDSGGNTWTLTSAGIALENGSAAAGGSGTGALTVYNGTLYAQDGSGSTPTGGSSTTAANGESVSVDMVNNQSANTSFTVTGRITGVAGGTTGGLTPPAAAAAVGFNAVTFGPNLILNKTITSPTTGYPTFVNGANIVPFTFFGTSWTNIGCSQNSDGSVSMDGSGQNYGNGLCTAAAGQSGLSGVTGVTFGGGLYVEAVAKGNGPMSFWGNDVEHMNDGNVPAWPNTPSNFGAFGNWIETDIMEFDTTGNYGWSPHSWYGYDDAGNSYGGNQGYAPNSNFYYDVNPQWGGPLNNFNGPPAGVDYTQYHKYGMLWVMATASTPGYMQMYFDGQAISNKMQWNLYDPTLPPPNTAGALINTRSGPYPSNTISDTVPSTAWSVLDTRHLAFICGGSPGSTTTFQSITVWQASGAGNIPVTSVGSGVPPTLQYQDGSGAWQSLPSGAIVSTTAFSFLHPALAASSSDTISVRDANNTAAAGVSNVFTVGSGGSGAWYTWNGTGFVLATTNPPTNAAPAVVELAYVGTQIWEKDALNNWYSTTTVAPITWVGPTTASPLSTVPGGLSYILPMKQAGIRVITYIKQESPASFTTGLASLRAEQAGNHDIFAYEGCQEPDTAVLTGTPETLANAASFQQTLKTAGTADGLPVIQTSFGVAADYGTTGNLAAFATYGNAHTYTGTLNCSPNDGPSPGFIATMTANALLTSPGLPVIHSEWGWKADHNSATAIASYVLDFIMSAYFDGNLPYYIVNGLYDDTTGQWGLFNNDQSPRLVATALDNFFALLQDIAGNALSFGPGKLNIAISNLPTGTNANMGGKFGVLQKADGSFWVLVRNEQTLTTSDANNHTPITVAPISCTATLGTLATTVAVYDPLIGIAPVQTGSNTSSITFSLPAHPVLIKIVRP